MYKLTRKTIKYVNYWLLKNGFDTYCVYESEWQYNPNMENIGIPKVYDDNSNIDFYFMETLRKLGLKTNLDCITYSLLHELGHFITLKQLSEKQYDKCNFEIGCLAIADLSEHDFYTKYWKVKSEKLANKWLVDFSNSHPKKCQELEDIIFQSLKRK